MIEEMFNNLRRVFECKDMMIKRKLMKAKAHCPSCKGNNSMILRLRQQRRSESGYHVTWRCNNCEYGGME